MMVVLSQRKISFCFLLATVVCFMATAQDRQACRVVDSTSGEPVVGAVVAAGKTWAVTDSLGTFKLMETAPGTSLTLSCLGYKTAKTSLSPGAVYRLQPDYLSIREVVVTAKEEKGVTAASVIGKDAIEHIQPSSLKDVLELLPGGRAVDPVLSSPQVVNLRSAAGVSAKYATTALGTSILVDGRPVGNDANLQYTPGYSSFGADFVNYGTDLRTLSTEDVESVEVVRGIASVEYGDLTSGLLKVTRKKGGNSLRARFKSDMSSKLLYAGKDFQWGRYTLNAGVNFLDSRADPRNPRQNYKRLTGNLRGTVTWTGKFKSVLDWSLDYTGSFDDEKSDLDLDFGSMGPIETYKSSYNRLDFSTGFDLSARSDESVFRNWRTSLSLSVSDDRIDRWKYNINGAEQPFVTASEPGEWDAIILPVRYESTLQVLGRPFYVFLSSTVSLKAGVHRIKAGLQWDLDKNFGAGSVFDVSRPFSTLISSRPRPYYDIPATHQLSLFVEESGKSPLSNGSLEWAAGARLNVLLGAGSEYLVNGTPYLDPRANLRYNLPVFTLGEHLFESGFYVGAGLHSKFPTMDMLHPDPLFGDILQFSYWPVERELRRANYLVYKVLPVNHELAPARNLKMELGFDASWNGYNFTIDGFVENMTTGFRYSSRYTNHVAKKYDGSGIDKSALVGPPSLDELPYQLDTVLHAYSVSSNGSQTLKTGIEFTFSSPRIPGVNTRITSNGAWFVTKNTNSTPDYYIPNNLISGQRFPYIGVYQINEGSTFTNLNTNLILDTQVPMLGLILTTSIQTAWFSNHFPLVASRYPISYLDKDLKEHPFTEADAADPVLRFLVRDDSGSAYDYLTPFSTYINLKATKKFYHDKLSCSLFVNRLLAIAPDYYMNGSYVRRASSPYFGMELNFNL
ncbi:MAG: TonB-dependent receptor [Bacteroidales bacterium]|nr:TonB-dependent receptor [Bacteroidales bacterium]